VRDVPISDPAPNYTPLRVAPGEVWCRRCYEPTVEFSGRSGDNKAACPRCGYTRFIPAAQVLQPDEYYIAT
jgi:DNA-directed RNA polymerase subunit RPC12/RpoP